MRKNRKPILLILIATLTLICLVVAVYSRVSPYCGIDQPQIPTYPGSVLLDKRVLIDGSEMKMISLKYEVKDTPSSVTDFFAETDTWGKCNTRHLTYNRVVCRGIAEPYGDYWVYINWDSKDNTQYAIELSWHKCS
jgi:hypothetical protein